MIEKSKLEENLSQLSDEQFERATQAFDAERKSRGGDEDLQFEVAGMNDAAFERWVRGEARKVEKQRNG